VSTAVDPIHASGEPWSAGGHRFYNTWKTTVSNEQGSIHPAIGSLGALGRACIVEDREGIQRWSQRSGAEDKAPRVNLCGVHPTRRGVGAAGRRRTNKYRVWPSKPVLRRW
jgi:hypothetical protein